MKVKSIMGITLLICIGFMFITSISGMTAFAATGDFMVNPPPSTFNVGSDFSIPSSSNSYIDTSRTNVVVITDNVADQRGAIWSKGRMDLAQPFVYKSYLYWGRSSSAPLESYGGQPGGDGMTFTLHNDSRSINVVGGLGGGLGAYAHGAFTAINNAISFEVDPFINFSTGDFDSGMVTNPTNPNLVRHTAIVNPSNAIGTVNHNSLKTFSEYPQIEDTWVPFEVSWQPSGANGTLTVTFNGVVSSHVINNYTSYFGSRYAHLGYTGATGGAAALQGVAVEELPVFSYNLSYNLGGATGVTPATEVVVYNQLAQNVPPNPTRPGFIFNGWRASNTGTNWNFATTRMPALDVVLTAQWTESRYTLSFDVNGGTSAAPPSQSLLANDLATSPSDPIRAGYAFMGWNTLANGSGTMWNFATNRMPSSNTVLYAQWSQNTFTLSFNVNGGSSAPPATQTLVVNDLATKPADPTRLGYTFTGWNTASNGSGTTWNFATSVMPSNNVILYAQWELSVFQLSFDVNGGTPPNPATQSVSFNALGVKPTDPVRPTYDFRGWNTQANGSGTSWDFNVSRMPANNVTLYAQWGLTDYQLSFNLNGGTSAAIPQQILNFGDLAVAPTIPTRLGYTFKEWNTQVDGLGSKWDFATTTMPSNNVTLYASWQINTYELSFNLNGGDSAPIPSQNIDFNSLATRPSSPTRTGYAFASWNTASDGSGSTWDFTTIRMGANNTVLYAQWNIESYELSFNLNGGTSAVIPPQTIAFNALGTKPTDPLKVGYTFVSWNTTNNGSGTTWDFTTSKMPANNVVLYAQWSINSYQLSFNLNGGESSPIPNQTIIYDDLAIEPPEPTRTGYTFKEWNTNQLGTGTVWNFTSSRMPANNVILYAQWQINAYVVSFDLNGGDSAPISNQSIDFNALITKPTDPTRIGYTFNGWGTTSLVNATIWNFTADRMPANNLTLYAQWNINTYSVDFNLNGGDSAAIPTQQIDFNELVIEPTDPQRDGYTFKGWSISRVALNNMWNFNSDRMPANNLTLYAQWSINTYEVTFDLNGGDSEEIAVQPVVYLELINEPQPAPSRIGHTFIGWGVSATDELTLWDFNVDTMPSRNLILYAHWQINTYVVTFDLNGGDSVAIDQQDVIFNDLVIEPQTEPSRIGYTFLEWGTTADTDSSTWSFNTNRMPAKNITLYAQWQINTYTVDFNLNGGDSELIEAQVIDYNNLVLKPDNPSRIGHTFTNWSILIDDVYVTWDFENDRVPANDITLHAQWTINSYTLDFDLNGGENDAIDAQTIVFNELANEPEVIMVREGYTFTGWSFLDDSNFVNWDFMSNRMPASDLTLVAQWDINSYLLEFDINGGEIDPIPHQLVVFNELAIEPEVEMIREGYTFTGWLVMDNQEPNEFKAYSNTLSMYKNSFSTNWDFNINRMPANSVTLQAQWEINVYQLDFDLNGASNASIPSQSVVFNEKAIEPDVKMTKDGHTFKGWMIMPSTVTDSFAQANYWDFTSNRMPSNDVILQAQWEVNNYQLKFDLNGGTSTLIASQSIEFDKLATEPKDIPTRKGYTFSEWNTQSDGKGDTWNFNKNRMPAYDVILYAQWKENKGVDLPNTGLKDNLDVLVPLLLLISSSLSIIAYGKSRK